MKPFKNKTKKSALIIFMLLLVTGCNNSAFLLENQEPATEYSATQSEFSKPTKEPENSSRDSDSEDALGYIRIGYGRKLIDWGKEYGGYMTDCYQSNQDPAEPIVAYGSLISIEIKINGPIDLTTVPEKILVNGEILAENDISIPFKAKENIYIRFDRYDTFDIEILKGIRTEDGKELKRDIKLNVTLKPQCVADLALLDENGEEKKVSNRVDYAMQGFIVAAPRFDMSDKTFLLHFSSDMDKESVEAAINNAEKVLLDLDMDTAYLKESLAGINYIFTWHDAKTLQIQINGLRESKYYPINLMGAQAVDGFTFYGFENFWCFTATTDIELIHETQEMQKFYLSLD